MGKHGAEPVPMPEQGYGLGAFETRFAFSAGESRQQIQFRSNLSWPALRTERAIERNGNFWGLKNPYCRILVYP